MHNSAWNLREAPLDSVRAQTAIYESPAYDEALSRLLFIIEQHRSCGLLYGPPGSGKSLLLEQLGQIVRRAVRELAVIDLHGRDSHEVLWELCGELGLGPRFNDNSYILWRRLQDHLLADPRVEAPAVLILDHADQGGEETSNLVARLVHLARQERGLTVIMGVRGRHLADLPEHLRDATDIRVELGWLDQWHSAQFVRKAFQSPDEDEGPLFDQAAIERLHELSEGSPRMLARLCDLSVLATLATDDAIVTEQAVRTAANDLQMVAGGSY
jgi:type II secretory pathway predicted ATPase ExeA